MHRDTSFRPSEERSDDGRCVFEDNDICVHFLLSDEIQNRFAFHFLHYCRMDYEHDME